MALKSNDVKMQDVEMQDSLDTISPLVLKELKELLFGKSPIADDVQRWHQQGFSFVCKPEEACCFGLSQAKGGPCGILAPIQGRLLFNLLFGGLRSAVNFHDSLDKPFTMSEETRRKGLLLTLADVICRACDGGQLILCVAISEDKLQIEKPSSKEDLLVLLDTFYEVVFASEYGVILFVYSVLLSRGAAKVKSDVDDPSQNLVERFGHTSVELVNLILTGQAVSNVFDGRKELQGLSLKGISCAQDVGYLTLLEAMRYSKVGDFYKNPQFPIWVIGSSSHYTIAFALKPDVGKLSKREKREQEIRKIWNQIDSEETGMIQAHQVAILLAELHSNFDPQIVASKADPDGMGVILWFNFLRALEQVENEQSQNWACPSCTFHNQISRSTCEVCGNTVPNTDAIKFSTKEPQSPDVSGPSHFPLYHFNGLGNRLARMQVWTEGNLGMPRDDYGAENLTTVLQTKWKNALVEYAGNEPKIN